MKKALLVGEVAALARDIEISEINLADFGITHVNTFDDPSETGSIVKDDKESTTSGVGGSGILEGRDFSSRNSRINELLGEWEVCSLQVVNSERVSAVLSHCRFLLIILFLQEPEDPRRKKVR